MIFVLENKGMLIVDRDTGEKKEVVLNTIYNGKRLPLFDKKAGVEGIAKSRQHDLSGQTIQQEKEIFYCSS